MRRKDRETDENFALGIVDKCEYSVLSMIDNQGEPYCVTVRIGAMRRNIVMFFLYLTEKTI